MANFLIADSPKLGVGNLLYAFQSITTTVRSSAPTNMRKFNGILRWSRSTPNTDFNVTWMGYHGTFQSSDQIPAATGRRRHAQPLWLDRPVRRRNDVPVRARGRISAHRPQGHDTIHVFRLRAVSQSLLRFHLLSRRCERLLQRHAQSGNVHARLHDLRRPAQNTRPAMCRIVPPTSSPPPRMPRPGSIVTRLRLRFLAAISASSTDERFVSGINVSRAFRPAGIAATTAGAGIRNDNISTVGLFLVHDDVVYPNGTLSLAHVVERDSYAWVQTLLRSVRSCSSHPACGRTTTTSTSPDNSRATRVSRTAAS